MITIGFTVPQLTANSRSPLAVGSWDMEIKTFKSGESSVKKTPFVQVVFRVVEDAVDNDGEEYKRDFYGDKFYLTSNAMFRLKNFADQAGVELPEAGEDFDTLAEYAAALTDLLKDTPVTVDVQHRKYRGKDQDEETPEEDWEGLVAEVPKDGYSF